MEDKNRNGTPKNRIAAGQSLPTPQPQPQSDQVRTPAGQEDWLAAQLHEARIKATNLRAELIEKTKQLLQRDQLLFVKEQQIHKLETVAMEAENKQLREAHGLALGRTIHKDDVTGEIYWMGEKKAE